MSKTISAQIGYGYWGKKVYAYLQDNMYFDCKYVFGCSLVPNGRFINNLDVILKDKEISSIFVITPIDTHYQIVKECLLAGKNIFCEKPLTLNLNEALELKQLAENKKLKLVTDFTYTFSNGLNEIKNTLYKLGNIRYIDIDFKQWGRFNQFDVYALLGTHALSIADMFISLDDVFYTNYDLIKTDKVETGLLFLNGSPMVNILVSLNSTISDKSITFYGSSDTLQYTFTNNISEQNNLKRAITYFYNVLMNKEKGNLNRAIRITKILDELKRRYYVRNT